MFFLSTKSKVIFVGQLHTPPVDLRAPNLYPPGNESTSHLRNRKIIFKTVLGRRYVSSLEGKYMRSWWVLASIEIRIEIDSSRIESIISNKKCSFLYSFGRFSQPTIPTRLTHFQPKKHHHHHPGTNHPPRSPIRYPTHPSGTPNCHAQIGSNSFSWLRNDLAQLGSKLSKETAKHGSSISTFRQKKCGKFFQVSWCPGVPGEKKNGFQKFLFIPLAYSKGLTVMVSFWDSGWKGWKKYLFLKKLQKVSVAYAK